VHKAVADIDRVTQENAALVEQTTAAAESLGSEANRLLEDMMFFKTSGQQSAPANRKAPVQVAKKSVAGISAKEALPTPRPASQKDEWDEF